MLLYVIVMVRDFVTYFVFYFLLFSREFVHFSIISKFEFFLFFGDIFEIREKKNVLTVFFVIFFFSVHHCSNTQVVSMHGVIIKVDSLV